MKPKLGESIRAQSWGEIKRRIEALGIEDHTQICFIDLDVFDETALFAIENGPDNTVGITHDWNSL